MAGLDDILNGTEETETETVTETEETTQAEETQEEVTTGEQETTASQVAAETETATEPEEVKGLKAAAAAERKKRQEIEEASQRRIAELEQQLAQRAAQEEEKPYLGEEYEARFTETDARFKQALVQQKLELSEAIAREQHPDFEEKLDTFKEMLKADPNLYNRMVSQGNPAGWMYKQASEHQQMQKLREIGDPAKYEADLAARLREQIKAELLAEQEAEKKAVTEAAIRAKLPKSGFAEERSSGTARATTKTYTGPTPLKSILG